MAVDRLREMGDLLTPMALRVAATLGLADLIADGVATAGGLAERTATDRDALARLLRHMASMGLLAPDGEGYRLTELGEPLRSTHPGGVARSLDANEVLGRIELSFVRLLDALRTGRAAYPLVHGRGFWEDLAADPELAARFERHMTAGDVGRAVAAYDWSAVGHLVDVGGGSGRLLVEILHAAPHARGTLVELPGPAEVGRRRFEEAGLSDRADVVAGTFFDPLPAGADAYVVANVLHDWGDAEAEAILRRCAEAAGASGRVLVFQGVLDGVEDQAPGTEFDLFMLVCCGGRQRTLAEFEAIGARAGLKLAAASPVDLHFGHLMEFDAASR
jgi:2,7-dihydroxy-5-methyl-1-naphthoate 7-O-methyltransferase